MKKFFTILSIIALAFTAVTFVSCSKDDDSKDDPIVKEEEQKPEPPAYHAVQFWASDDLLAICDFTCTEFFTSYSFSNAKDLGYGAGKAGAGVEYTKDDVGKNVKITFTLKENWKEIVGDRKAVVLITGHAQITNKGDEFVYLTHNIRGGELILGEDDDEKHLNMLLDLIQLWFTI